MADSLCPSLNILKPGAFLQSQRIADRRVQPTPAVCERQLFLGWAGHLQARTRFFLSHESPSTLSRKSPKSNPQAQVGAALLPRSHQQPGRTNLQPCGRPVAEARQGQCYLMQKRVFSADAKHSKLPETALDLFRFVLENATNVSTRAGALPKLLEAFKSCSVVENLVSSLTAGEVEPKCNCFTRFGW